MKLLHVAPSCANGSDAAAAGAAGTGAARGW